MQNILVFGNPYINEDNLALHVADAIVTKDPQGIKVIRCCAPEEIFDYLSTDFVILDVVRGIDEVVRMTDIDRLRLGKRVSLHDFDLGFFLKLMKETGQIDSVRIIGIPAKGDVLSITDAVLNLLPFQDPENV